MVIFPLLAPPFPFARADPVRIHEKAQDDYADRFHDEVLAEACVADVLRSRVVCTSGTAMLHFIELLAKGFEHEIEGGEKALLEIVRLKNKMGTDDPTHFRNMLCNLKLSFRGAVTFVEMQAHHRAILKHNDTSHAHDH